jgi:hypothetical protein
MRAETHAPERMRRPWVRERLVAVCCRCVEGPTGMNAWELRTFLALPSRTLFMFKKMYLMLCGTMKVE